MKQTKITISSVDGLKQNEVIWDTEVHCFGVRRQIRDKVYIVKTRVNGKQRQFTIGKHGSPWTPTEARTQAKRILGDIASGEDLHAVRAGKRQQATVSELAERYIKEHAIPNKKPSSVKTDQSNLKNHVIPFFGDLLAKEVTLEHVDKFMNNLAVGNVKKNHSSKRKGGSEIAGGHGVANRCRALLSKMFSLAEKWRVIPQNSNPVKHAVKFKENTVEQYLSDEQMTKLGEVLENKVSDGTFSIHFINAIRLLLLTGARLGEVQSLKWEHIDHQRRIAFLPDSKTGKKPLPLSDAALEVINSTPKVDGNPHVFAGKNEGAPIINFRKAWGNIRKEADLDNFRLHDLRHNFASAAINAGTSLAVVGALLGHKNLKTTQRYAHLADTIVHVAGNATAQALADTLAGKSDATEVIGTVD